MSKGYIYVNSLNNNSKFTDIDFTNVRYTFDNSEDVIIYIEKTKNKTTM